VELAKEMRAKTREFKGLSKQVRDLNKEAEKKSHLVESLEIEIARYKRIEEKESADASSGYVCACAVVRVRWCVRWCMC
jgi:ribosomal 50S subunit-associated protein YjgA (DUF615 family)